MTDEKTERNFILNPCMPEGEDVPMVLISTGFKDYIGGFAGFEEDTGEAILLFPLSYQDIVQSTGPNSPPRVSAGMQPVYLPLKVLDTLLINPVTTYFLKEYKDEDRQLVDGYEHMINHFRFNRIVQPSSAEVRKLTLAPE